MSLQFIIGSSGSGKTRRLYEDLIRRSMQEPEAQFIAVVPEQFTMQTQKEIVKLHPDHGTMNIDIVSFNRLAYRVFEELGVKHLAVLDDMGKSMVLRKVAAQQRRNLTLYAGHLNQTGFINQLKSMLSELYQYGIGTEDLLKVRDTARSALLKAKCSDLAVICSAFREAIEERFITAEEILDVLCRVIPESDLIRRSVITLDGYTGFTPVQYRLLELMMVHARQVIVTVTVDPLAQPYRRGKQQNLFYMGKEMIFRLSRLAAGRGVERDQDILLGAQDAQGGNGQAVPRRFADSRDIAFIEKHLYRYDAAADWEPRELKVIQASGPKEEIAAVASRIRRLVSRGDIRYREIAVITGDLPGYRHELVSRFQAEGIPFFMDNKKSILENAMVEFIRAGLEAVRKDFDYESVFRYLKTGLVTENVQELDRLENYCIALGIRGFGQWSRTWDRTFRGGKNLNLDMLNEFRQEIVAPLAKLRQSMRRDDRTVQTMNEAVAEWLSDCCVREKMQQYRDRFEAEGRYSLAKEYEQIYDRVTELFDRLGSLLGTEKVSLKEYMEILDAGFGEIMVGVIPATADRVVVGDITRTRLDLVKVLFFVGVNEGVVPVRKDNRSLLTDMDREVFKECQIELAPASKEDSFNQRYYLYLMMTKPSKELVVSYCLLDAEGKGRRPSSLIGELKRMFPLLKVREASEDVEEIVSLTSGRELLIRGLREYAAEEWTAPAMPEGVQDQKDGAAEDEACAGRLRTRQFLALYRRFLSEPEYREMVGRLTDAAFYSYEKKGIGRAAARALYGKVLQGSVTRLEQYAACAYAHFLNYGLELTERQEYQIAAVDMGNLFHSSIDLCFKEMAARGISADSLGEEDRRRLVRECVGQVAADYGNTILASSARYQYLAERIERMTDRTIWALSEQLKKGDFAPVGFEVSFSSLDELKAMRIPLSREESLHLRGRVDRLDLCEDGSHVYVKIIDYKSGSTRFDLASVYYGLQLQLVVYMDAAVELTRRRYPGKEVAPAGIFYYNIKDPLVDRTYGQTREDIDTEILRQLRMNGLVNSDLDVIRHMDREITRKSDVIPVAMKDGLVQESMSSVASGRRFELLSGYVRSRLKKDGQEILDGSISVEPHKQGTSTACGFCPYHGVCGFDTRIAGYRYRHFPEISPEQIWEDVEKSDSEGGGEDELDG